MTQSVPTLATLPSEILSQICDAVEGPGPSARFRQASLLRQHKRPVIERNTHSGHRHALCPLSATCHSIRAVCASSMFRSLTVTEYQMELPPPTILPYARRLKLKVVDLAASRQLNYADLLSQLPGPFDLVWTPQYPVSLSVRNMEIISHASSSSSLTIGDFYIECKLRMAFPSHLRVLDLSHWRRNLFTLTREDARVENATLEIAISPVAHELEVLRLPAETCRLSFLASNAWPNLRELTLRGGTPRLDAPFAQVLAAMPHLRVLAATFLRFPSMPLVLLAADTDATVCLQLSRLTITDPEPDEAIFSHIADTLEELCVRDMPRHYVRRVDHHKYSAGLLPCSTALSIIRSLRATNLRRLELVVREDDAELDLVTAIASSSPSLEYLEFHRYARDDLAFIELSKSRVDVPMLAIANALTPLKRLRMLRLNMDLGVHVDVWKQRPADVHEYWHPFIERQVMLIAPVLPWLSSISFLTAQTLSTLGWSTWELACGGTQVRHLRHRDCVDCDCTWL